MSLPTARTLERIRARQLELLPAACTISRRVVVRDATGSATGVYAAVAAAVPCRLSPPTPDVLHLVGGNFTTTPSWVLTVPYGTDVRLEDHATIAGDDGRTWKVTGVLDHPASWNTAGRYTVAEVPA